MVQPTVPPYVAQQGDGVRREQITSAVPLPDQPSQGAAAQPVAPPTPQGAAPGQSSAPDEEEFLSPLAAAGLTYEQSVALFNKQIAANLAVDERSHPDLKELYWAIAQDAEEMMNGKAESNQGSEQSSQDNVNQKTPANSVDNNSEMIALLKEIRDGLNGNKGKA